MLGTLLWALLLLAGLAWILGFAWRSAMRRRGFRLVARLEEEGVVRQAVDVPVERGDGARAGLLGRRGTVVLTRTRIAGFSHRARFVMVRGRGFDPGALGQEGEWLVVRPRRQGGGRAVGLRYRVGDAARWVAEARRILGRG